ncbi:ATP-binding protein [Thalassotalea sp. G2M2-11]|uniref:two-component system sensor histidine kinase NtrB n=1 Tax=Thalassotalea sp. G2M2-11 TaxID=2787627 RepID=UPI0019D0D62C|nr:ATP-binding protein [Thalassotalea sp. G2M2-11]
MNHKLFFLAINLISIKAFASTDSVSITYGLTAALIVLTFIVLLYLLRLSHRASANYFEVVKHSSQPVFITDKAGKLIFANDVALTLVGQSLAQLKASSIFDLIDGIPTCLSNNIPCQLIEISKICSCDKLSNDKGQFSVIHKSGAKYPANISVLKQSTGDFVYFLQELTTQKKLERQLEKQNKVATLGEFLAGILHELGNPMAAIEGIATELLWHLENNKQSLSIDYVKEQLNTIQVQTRRISQVKNEFSLISSDTEQQACNLQLIDIQSLLKQLVDLARFDKRSRHISIELETTGQLPAVYSDIGQLTQILLNVLSNAMDALQEREYGNIKISTTVEAGAVKATILDNGPGIEENKLKKVFEPFYTTKSEGTGLGLMICKRLADSLGIQLGITSESSKSTEVELVLPINRGVS